MKIRILLPILIFCSAHLLAQDVALPELNQRVTDLTGTLAPAEQEQLERKLQQFEEAKGSQVAVVLIPTTGDETIEQYAIRLAEKWKIGREGVDDGVIMLFAMQDRKMRIEVGYGLEGALTDALSKRIIANLITPEFRSAHFYKGIDSGVDAVLSVISGEELPPALQKQSQKQSSSNKWVMPVLIFGFVGAAILKALLTKKLGKGKATGVSAVLVFVLGWIFIGLLAGVFIAVIVAIFMGVPSNSGRGGRGGGMMWMGGGGFSGGGGGGFGGGFSGGGGGFGGGGASGGW